MSDSQSNIDAHGSAGSDGEPAELMYVKCARCGKWMDVKPGHINSISHSYCPECFAEEMRKLNLPNPGTRPRAAL